MSGGRVVRILNHSAVHVESVVHQPYRDAFTFCSRGVGHVGLWHSEGPYCGDRVDWIVYANITQLQVKLTCLNSDHEKPGRSAAAGLQSFKDRSRIICEASKAFFRSAAFFASGAFLFFPPCRFLLLLVLIRCFRLRGPLCLGVRFRSFLRIRLRLF